MNTRADTVHAVRTLHPSGSLILVPLLVLLATILSGCGSVQDHLNRILNEYSCQKNVQPIVGKDREAILYVRHHIFVGEGEPGSNNWVPRDFTCTPKEPVCWENRRLVLYRKLVIERLMNQVNELFYANHMNIYLVTDAIDVQVEPQIFPSDFDLLSTPVGHSSLLMRRFVRKAPRFLHFLWGWTSDGTTLAAGRNGAILIGDNPRGGRTIDAKIAGREILHALGYFPLDTQPYELMHYEGDGRFMEQKRRGKIWDLINARTPALESLSCMPAR